VDLYQDWRHDTCLGCARCVHAGDPAVRTDWGWLVWLGWHTEFMPPTEYAAWPLTSPELADLLEAGDESGPGRVAAGSIRRACEKAPVA
jgi:hypothetical protein